MSDTTITMSSTSRAQSPDQVRYGAIGDWVTDRAWICGLAGAFTVLGLAAFYYYTNALSNGLVIAGFKLTFNRLDTILAALYIITAVMVIVEMLRLWMRDRSGFICIDPDIRYGRYLNFIGQSLINYLKYLCLFYLVVLFFHWAGEYGFQRNAPYYRAWFRFIDVAFYAYLWAGLPYVLLTRALKHDPYSDKRDLASLFTSCVIYLFSYIPYCKDYRKPFSDADKKAIRGLLVKLFFTPLMTVFFADQFPHLVSNVGYVFGSLPNNIANGYYSHVTFNNDLFNISKSVIFSIDVGLAWVGYVVSSRWVDNQTASAEPTVMGWVVCVCCYPPFQMFLGLYFPVPSESEVLRIGNQWFITLFTFAMVASYFVYMAATLWFGVRFSNLTNRGIIRTGPFALIRHPAYASKNFAWWCVMFPGVLYNSQYNGVSMAVLYTLGLCFMTWFYYLRAQTEENHLSADPHYVEYRKQVKYKFIPGVI